MLYGSNFPCNAPPNRYPIFTVRYVIPGLYKFQWLNTSFFKWKRFGKTKQSYVVALANIHGVPFLMLDNLLYGPTVLFRCPRYVRLTNNYVRVFCRCGLLSLYGYAVSSGDYPVFVVNCRTTASKQATFAALKLNLMGILALVGTGKSTK